MCEQTEKTNGADATLDSLVTVSLQPLYILNFRNQPTLKQTLIHRQTVKLLPCKTPISLGKPIFMKITAERINFYKYITKGSIQ